MLWDTTRTHLDHEHEGERERGQDQEDGDQGDQVSAEAGTLSALHIMRGESIPTLLQRSRNP